MMIEIYRNPDTGDHWQIYSGKEYSFPRNGKFRSIRFYPFLTTRCSYYCDLRRDDTYSFTVSILWLFWSLNITRYWGKGYQELIDNSFQ